MKKQSSLYFTAEEAVTAAIPPASRALIEQHDELYAGWRIAGYPRPTPPEVQAASKAIDADPQAKIAMDLRRLGNDAAYQEWDARQKSAETPTNPEAIAA